MFLQNKMVFCLCVLAAFLFKSLLVAFVISIDERSLGESISEGVCLSLV